jgi:hypothetical protein
MVNESHITSNSGQPRSSGRCENVSKLQNHQVRRVILGNIVIVSHVCSNRTGTIMELGFGVRDGRADDDTN